MYLFVLRRFELHPSINIMNNLNGDINRLWHGIIMFNSDTHETCWKSIRRDFRILHL